MMRMTAARESNQAENCVENATRVVICEAEQLFREGLRLLLSSAGLEISQTASCLSEWDGEADVVIWGVSGHTDAAPQLTRLLEARGRAAATRFVVVADGANSQLIRQLAASGVDAVLSRDISGQILHRALDLVMLGQQLFPAAVLGEQDGSIAFNPGLSVSPVPGTPGTPSLAERIGPAVGLAFSDRELEILTCLVAGSPNKLIARDLKITEATVKVHIKNLLRKIGANNRTQAATWSLANGFVPAALPKAGS